MLSSAAANNIQVVTVFKNLPADQAGIRVGDRIVAINGVPIVTANGLMDLHYWVRGLTGSQVEFTLIDPQGATRSVRVDNREPAPLPFGLPVSFFAWGTAVWDLLFILGYLSLGAVIVVRAREDPFAVLMAYLLALIAIRLPGELSLAFIEYPGWSSAPSLVNSLGYLVIFSYSLNVLPGLFPGLVATTGSSFLYSLGQRIDFLPMLVIAFALAFSILRYRLWDVDVIIRRTLVYTLTLAALAGVYLGSVLLLEQLFRTLTGESSNLAVVVSTLAIVVLFSPLQRLVRRVIDQRFYRSRYDAALILSTFAAASRSEVDLNHLTGELTRAVDQTMMPRSISLWIRPVEKRN